MDPERQLHPMWWALAGLRFLAELGLLTALGYVGWVLVEGPALLRVLLAACLPLLAAAVWGRWVAPRASRRLEDPARLAVEVVLFAGAVVALAVLGSPVAAALLAAAYLVGAPAGRKGL